MATLAFRAVRSPASLQTGVQRLTLGGGGGCHQFSRASLISSSRRVSTPSAITKTSDDENLVSVLDTEIEYADYEEAPDVSFLFLYFESVTFPLNRFDEYEFLNFLI